MYLTPELVIALLALARPDVAAVFPAPTAPGLYAFVDPDTGRLLEAPPAGREPDWMPWEIENALSTSSEGLVERVTPSGAIALDLDGRFHHALFATVDAGGRVRYDHQAPAAPANGPQDGSGSAPDEVRP